MADYLCTAMERQLTGPKHVNCPYHRARMAQLWTGVGPYHPLYRS